MRNQQSKHDVQGCTIAVAQSRCKDAATPTTANARMRDSACPKFRKDAKPTEQAHFDNPAPLHFVITNRHSPAFFGAGGENPHSAGKAMVLAIFKG